MCGPDSVEVVEKKVTRKTPAGLPIVVTATKIAFLVGEDGKIGESHSAIRSAAKIQSNHRYVNVNGKNGKFVYENEIPAWYEKLQVATEKKLANMFKKMAVSGPAYAKRVAAAQKVFDKALVAARALKTDKARAAAENKALKVFQASKKTAFAAIAKLGGIAQ